MTGTPTTYTGSDADFLIATKDEVTLGLSDFSLNISRDTNELDLTGQKGNYHAAGAISVDGSFTAASVSNIGTFLDAMINGTTVSISGSVGTNSLHFYFKSAMITGFDLSIGDANTFTQGSIDWTLKYPYNVNEVENLADGGTRITDF